MFGLGRRQGMAELKMPESSFEHMGGPPEEEEDTLLDEPDSDVDVSPANELATSLVERDIADAVREGMPPAQEEVRVTLSQRHLETIDRMVDHLLTDEQRLERQILDAQRELADTQLTRRSYQRNAEELRDGIAKLTKLAETKPPAAAPPPPIPPIPSVHAASGGDSDATIVTDDETPPEVTIVEPSREPDPAMSVVQAPPARSRPRRVA